ANICDITDSGLLLTEAGLFRLQRVDDQGEVVTVAELPPHPSFMCGSLAEDPSSDRIWVALPSLAWEDASTLYTFDGAGNLLVQEELTQDGESIIGVSLAAEEGRLTIAGTVWGMDSRQSLLQSRSGGTIEWTQLGYPAAEAPDFLSTNINEVGFDAGGPVFLSAATGFDSSRISLHAADPLDGTERWSDLIIGDDFSGQRARLAVIPGAPGPDEILVDLFEPASVTGTNGARVTLLGYGPDGTRRSSSEYRFAGLTTPWGTARAAAAGHLYGVVGFEQIGAPETHALRLIRELPGDEFADCMQSLDSLGFARPRELVARGGQLLLTGTLEGDLGDVLVLLSTLE
ncbi:MAG: hypothetical protein KC431_20300, partial [Myxococcales bacterium]|nr:hypothetical protein [Myxococcales bacterium]